jgi:alanine-glyoxylate transaminase/serine-glyoxylate transaminase/serine-pyruvate transaminase
MNRFSPSTPRIPGIRFVHSPGPTRVPDEVMHAMQRPMTDLSDPRVAAMIAECESGMKRLLHSPNSEVFLFASNGHGMWESAAANLASPQHTLLLAGSGHFSDQWAIQIEGLGIALQRTPYQEGHPFDVAAIEQALREDKDYSISAVLVVHTDTASGVTSDLEAVRRAIDAASHPALYVVDVVASLAASPFDMDALGVDVALGSSQKGLMMPPGLGFVAVNAQAMAWSAQHADPRFYWDWQRRQSTNQSAKFCGTPPLAHIAGLETAIALLEAEGLPNVWARHQRLAGAVHAAVVRWAVPGAMRFHARLPETRSASVTAIEVVPGIDPEVLRTVARERFQVAMAGGLGPLAGRVFRIGHLGDMNEPMILGALAGIEAAMTVQKIPFGTDGVAAAVAFLAAQSVAASA